MSDDEIVRKYTINPKHRSKPTGDICTWIIDEKTEKQIWEQAISENWIADNKSWGIKVENSRIIQVGTNIRKEFLIIGKFIDGNRNEDWHGYPANYVRNNHDVPPESILSTWLALEMINRAKWSRIRRQKDC